MAKTNGELLTFMRETIDRIRSQKQAAATTEAGGYSGPSTHPSAKEDDQSQPAPEGARSAENTADVKEDVHAGTSVDSYEGSEAGGTGDHQHQVGIQQSATGEDPSSEDADKINKKDDQDANLQQTSHPAKGASVSDPIKEASLLGDKILARIAVLSAPEDEEKEAAHRDKTYKGRYSTHKDKKKKKYPPGYKMSAEGGDQTHYIRGEDTTPQDDNAHEYDEDKAAAKESDADAAKKKDEKAAADADDSEKGAAHRDKMYKNRYSKDKGKKKYPPGYKMSAEELQPDFDAGYEAAKVAAEALGNEEKIAAEVLSHIEKQAAVDADTYCDFLYGFQDGQTEADKKGQGKSAMHDMEDMDKEERGETHEDEEKDEEEERDEEGETNMDAESAVEDMMPPAEPGAAAGVPPGLEALLGGAGGAGGAMPPGAMPPGAMPPGAGPPGAAPPMSEADLMAALQQAVAETGMGPGAMQVAASYVDEARARDEGRQIKVAQRRQLVETLKERIRGVKQAAEAEAQKSKEPEPVAAAAEK